MAEAVLIGFYFFVLIFSAIVHEVAHGYVAERLGDPTARLAGRLTLNPVSHLDLFGSFLFPLLLYFSTGGAVVFGWAKPVPYNPDNLSNRRLGTLWVACAGILANFCIAIIFGIIIRFVSSYNLSESFYFITSTIVVVNLALGLFNLVPIPPLDGSKILFSFLPESAFSFMIAYERYAMILLLVFIVFFSDSLYPILAYLFNFLTGLAF